MRLPKSRALRISLAILLALVTVPALAMAYLQTLEPPSGVRSAAELRVPEPSARPAQMGAGVQLDSFVQGLVSDGPGISVNPNPHRMGDASAGREVFRFETFGNEGFWTDALRWLRGLREARVTPLKVLAAGMLIDVERIEPALLAKLAAEARTDLTPARAPLLNSHETLLRVIEMNALVGVPAKDSNGDGRINLARGDKAGVSCAICHTVADSSVLRVNNRGSIGKITDGPAALVFDMGQFLAWGANTKAYYPNAQISYLGVTIGRAPRGLTSRSSEADFARYFTNKAWYPVGTFDETQDGIGNPVVNQPLFRQDLAAPWSSSAEFRFLDNISNGSYTQNLDPTILVTKDGRAFAREVAGPLGMMMTSGYARVLRTTGVTGFPYVRAAVGGTIGTDETQVRRRVDNRKLFDMSAYISRLPAPRGARVDPTAFARGRETFRRNCTACHNVDQSKPVPPLIVGLKQLWPGYRPIVLMPRVKKLGPVQNSPGIYDDKLIIADATKRGDPKGIPMPLLLDLARKPRFLHDASVHGLDSLLDPRRGSKQPHPFYVADRRRRAEVVAFLRGVDTTKR
jgi:mono/diheme cytochrome c family protein